ncbi:MAG: alkaline phosphatase family protein [Candidatus Binatia bacterium]
MNMDRSTSLLQGINHFVVVMLENRSFDHMLGFLYANRGNKSPLGQPFEGLTGNETNPDGKGGKVKAFQIRSTDPHPYFMPGANPGEGYLNTNSQLFGTTQAPSPIVPAVKRFGVRVPTVLVSPLITAGTVYRAAGPTPFDHTSILATVEKRFGLASLTKRDAVAPDVGGVLTLAQARTDDPLKGVKVPSSGKQPKAPKAPSHLEQKLAESAENLPVSDKPGPGYHHEMPPLRSSADVLKYVRARHRAYDRKLTTKKG